MFYVYVFVYHMCAWVSVEDVEWALDPLEPELQMVVSHHVGTRKLNPGPLEEQPVLFSTELSLSIP